MPQPILPLDPADRPVDFRPTKTPYDPRHMLAGTNGPDGRWLSGFFDRGAVGLLRPCWFGSDRSPSPKATKAPYPAPHPA